MTTESNQKENKAPKGNDAVDAIENKAPKGNEAVDAIEDKIDEVIENIEETPKEDQDKEWREKVNSALGEISEQLKTLTKAKGQSPEITALTQQVRELAEQVASLQKPTSAPSGSGEAAQPSQGTPPETSSATVPPSAEPPAAEAPARRNARRWI